MDGRQIIFRGWKAQPGPVLVGVLSAVLLAGCSGSDAIPDATLVAVPGNTIPVQQIDHSGDRLPAGQSMDDETPGLIDQVRYPLDNENDYPVGMIVTGVDETGSSMAVSPWMVTVRLFRRESDPSNKGQMVVELTRYDEDFPVSAHLEFFAEPMDTCMIRNSESEQGVELHSLPPPAINGGETVVLNRPSGPWLSLERTLMPDQQLSYRALEPLPGAMPADTTLSIPGGAFPTVAAYPLFEPEPVVRLLPVVLQPITAESRFSWVPSNRSTHVKIDFMAFDAAGDFDRYPVSCWVIDDGTFELPGAVLESLELLELQADGDRLLTVRYSRVYSRVDLRGGIVFHQRVEIAE